MNIKNILFSVIMFVIITIIMMNIISPPENELSSSVIYSEFLSDIENDKVDKVLFKDDIAIVSLTDGTIYKTFNIEKNNISVLVGSLQKHKVMFGGISEGDDDKPSILMQIFISWFPMLLLLAVWIFFMRQMSGKGPGGGTMSFGKSKAKQFNPDNLKVTFDEVAGCDEAKQEVKEVVEFLKSPEKFLRVGAKIPKGILLVGSPGTGKTLLARAIATHSGANFFSISGSDFVEMFVGVGASRVRDMFEQAKKFAPAIIFIDEIDAVGRHRGAGVGGGHDEREQTLNQLLVEMDGFDGNKGIIIIAATNRPDVLDPALLRPGRFDRQVTVPMPDLTGRVQIAGVHLKKIQHDDSLTPEIIGKSTPGFSGADLANVVNETAIHAARRDATSADYQDFEEAKDKIMMGSERKGLLMDDEEKRLTAYHEAGHCIIGERVKDHDPTYKVTIIPRGRALGVTMFLPERDRVSYTKQQLIGRCKSLYGGRVAEEMILGKDNTTTGASNDLKVVTGILHDMITKYGYYEEELGMIVFAEDEGEVFLGKSVTQHKHMSEETSEKIDEIKKVESSKILNSVRSMLEEDRDILDAMANALIKYETLHRPQIEDLMNRKPIKPIEEYESNDITKHHKRV